MNEGAADLTEIERWFTDLGYSVGAELGGFRLLTANGRRLAMLVESEDTSVIPVAAARSHWLLRRACRIARGAGVERVVVCCGQVVAVCLVDLTSTAVPSSLYEVTTVIDAAQGDLLRSVLDPGVPTEAHRRALTAATAASAVLRDERLRRAALARVRGAMHSLRRPTDEEVNTRLHEVVAALYARWVSTGMTQDGVEMTPSLVAPDDRFVHSGRLEDGTSDLTGFFMSRVSHMAKELDQNEARKRKSEEAKLDRLIGRFPSDTSDVRASEGGTNSKVALRRQRPDDPRWSSELDVRREARGVHDVLTATIPTPQLHRWQSPDLAARGSDPKSDRAREAVWSTFLTVWAVVGREWAGGSDPASKLVRRALVRQRGEPNTKTERDNLDNAVRTQTVDVAFALVVVLDNVSTEEYGRGSPEGPGPTPWNPLAGSLRGDGEEVDVTLAGWSLEQLQPVLRLVHLPLTPKGQATHARVSARIGWLDDIVRWMDEWRLAEEPDGRRILFGAAALAALERLESLPSPMSEAVAGSPSRREPIALAHAYDSLVRWRQGHDARLDAGAKS
jgi:hypothetical protein